MTIEEARKILSNGTGIACGKNGCQSFDDLCDEDAIALAGVLKEMFPESERVEE